MTQTIVSEKTSPRAWDKELQTLEEESKRLTDLSTAMNNFLHSVNLIIERAPLEAFKAEEAGVGLIHRAVEENNIPVVTYLLDNGSDVNTAMKDGQTPLHIATVKGTIPMMQVLIEAGADVRAQDARGRTPIDRAGGNANTLKLLQFVAGIETLDDVLKRGDIEEIKKYLKKNPESVAKMAGTALHNAATVEIAKELLNAGAPINGKDSAKRTPLKFAIEKDNKEMVEFLMAQGSVVDSRDVKAMSRHFGHEFTKDMAPSYMR